VPKTIDAVIINFEVIGNKEAFYHPCSGWRLSGPLLSKEGSLVP
jgi:hypothetical protein